jgi:uncharacterized protein
MITRDIEHIVKGKFFKSKAIIISGPRQVGKTTLVRSIVNSFSEPHIWFNGDEPSISEVFNNISSGELKQLFGKNKIVVIDEAQKINNIGVTLKIITDSFPEIQVVATGSSSFELANKLSEPLTGRKFEYFLFPISYDEMMNEHGILKERELLSQRLIFGSYPEIINYPDDAQENLKWLSDSYLYKDLLSMETIKKPSLLMKLLQALSWQVGNEVSYSELSHTIGSDPKTVEKYIDLLEKTYVVFRLQSLSRNLRNELKKSRKVYFYDNGIRNSIIGDFSRLELRKDIGALWENYLICERRKYLEYKRKFCKQYFWRTAQKQEIDYIEENDGMFHAYEFKYNPKRNARLSKTFSNGYPEHTFFLVNNGNYHGFLTEEKL